jgi:adenylate cyclase
MAVAVRRSNNVVVNRETIRVHVPLAILWELLSNTQRVNQTLGLPSAVFTPLEGGGGMDAKATFMGMKFNWIERPFEWVMHRWYRVQRDFEGPLNKTVIGVEFQEAERDHTNVTITVEVEPNNPVGQVMARTVFGRNTLQQYRTMIQEWERKHRQREALAFPILRLPEINQVMLDKIADELRRDSRLNVPAPMIDRLVAHLRTAPDDEVVRMRPLALADAWGFDRMQMVRLFLHATRRGMVDLHWEVLCPNCRVSKASYEKLTALEGMAHCETCQITFDATFDQYVELRFSTHPSIRSATAYTYCVGGPFVTRHIVAQQRVPAHSQHTVTLNLTPGEYRLRCGGTPGRGMLIVTEESAENSGTVTLGIEGVEPIEVALTSAGQNTLTLDNTTDEEQLFIVERGAWDAQVLSAARVTTLQEFRDLFSSEVLGVGMGVEIRTLNVLFTDLKNSTKLYLEAGDSRAYSQVRDQFAVLVEAITRHRGALVKTIGDSVMAVFYEGTDAIRAGLAMQAGVKELNERYPDRLPLRLKVGIHSGPCIVITANDTLDYFGTTVNTASYAGTLGMGGDIVLTDSTLQQAGVHALLADLPAETFTRPLKGMETGTTFIRVTPLIAVAEENALPEEIEAPSPT